MDIISCCIHLSSGQVKLNNNLICSRLYLSAAILDQEVIYRSDFVVRIYGIEPVLSFPFSSSFKSKIVRTSSLHPLIFVHWIDDDWYIGRLKEVPGVLSQGESPEELEENIRDAYRLMAEGKIPHQTMAQTKELIRKQLGLKRWQIIY